MVANDAARSIGHAEPECPTFLKLLEQNPPDETREVKGSAVDAHMDALARRRLGRPS